MNCPFYVKYLLLSQAKILSKVLSQASTSVIMTSMHTQFFSEDNCLTSNLNNSTDIARSSLYIHVVRTIQCKWLKLFAVCVMFMYANC